MLVISPTQHSSHTQERYNSEQILHWKLSSAFTIRLDDLLNIRVNTELSSAEEEYVDAQAAVSCGESRTGENNRSWFKFR